MTFLSEEKLAAFLSQNCAMEQWLKGEVAAAIDALKEDPERGLSIAQVRQRLASEHSKAPRLCEDSRSIST